MAIWNPAQELRELEEKVATSKEERVCPSWLLVPKTALREAGWDITLVEEAIERGKKKKEGEDVGEASWQDLEDKYLDEEAAKFTKKLEEAPNDMSDTPKVPGYTPTAEDEDLPARVPRMRINLLGKESQVVEKLRKEGLDPPEDSLWDCPGCRSVNALNENQCPQCGFSMRKALQIELEWKEMKERAVKKHGLPLDTTQVEETLLEMSQAKTNMEAIKDPKRPEPSLVDIEAALQEKAAEVGDTDTRKRVLVSEELGWLCEDCNRVWPIEYEKCIICFPEEKEKYEIPVTPPTIESRAWDDILEEQAKKKEETYYEDQEQEPDFDLEGPKPHADLETSLVPEGEKLPEGTDMSEEVRKSNMKFADKALLLLQLKSKEKKDVS